MRTELNSYYLKKIQVGYKNSTKKEKSKILEDAIRFTGLSRKRLITLLGSREVVVK
jgi:uncharacterized protein YajQ (UPF0234 family)